MTYAQCDYIGINVMIVAVESGLNQCLHVRSSRFGQQIQRDRAEDNQLRRCVMAGTGLIGSLYHNQP